MAIRINTRDERGRPRKINARSAAAITEILLAAQKIVAANPGAFSPLQPTRAARLPARGCLGRKAVRA